MASIKELKLSIVYFSLLAFENICEVYDIFDMSGRLNVWNLFRNVRRIIEILCTFVAMPNHKTSDF